jgi:hypothetical protein
MTVKEVFDSLNSINKNLTRLMIDVGVVKEQVENCNKKVEILFNIVTDSNDKSLLSRVSSLEGRSKSPGRWLLWAAFISGLFAILTEVVRFVL